MATGIFSNPFVAELPGLASFTGQVLHASEYHRPADIGGRRVLVVGVGNSGGEIASELANGGIAVDVAVRSGANVVPLTLGGIPIQYLSSWLRKLPRPVQEFVTARVQQISERRRAPSPLPKSVVHPLDAVPIIGFHLVDAIRAGRVGVRAGIGGISGDLVTFADGSTGQYDALLLATGYRAALGPLGDLVTCDGRGFPPRTDRVTSAEQPSLWFVGFNYDTTGGLLNIARDAPLAAKAVAAPLGTKR